MVVLVHVLEAAGFGVHVGMGVMALTGFFVLSGYLITGLLSSEYKRSGTVQIGRFYRNRAVRLLPALVAVLVVYVFAEAVLDRTKDPVWLTSLVGITYVGNLPFLRDLTGMLRQLWSLAFEEQFYLVWPALFIAASRRAVAASLTAWAIAASTAMLLITLALSSDHPERIYTLPTTWAAPVLIGCLAQLRRDEVINLLHPGTRRGLPMLAFGLGGFFVFGITWDHRQPWMYLGGPALGGAACLVIVLWLEQWREVKNPILRPVVGLGVISYGVYLWHYPVVMYARFHIADPAALIAAAVVLSLMLATASWFLIERPAQRWRRGHRRAPAPASAS